VIIQYIYLQFVQCILSFIPVRWFLANVNSRSRSLFAVARPSVCLSSVTFVRPTDGSNFRQYFYGIRYLGHPLKISRRSSQGNPSAGGVKHKRGSQI